MADDKASYKSFWNSEASTPERARSSTYAEDEAHFRSSGRHGDAKTYGAEHFLKVAGLDKTSRVLEIGCGMARVGRELAEHVGEWYGVDVSGGMLEHARQSIGHLPNVHLFELHSNRLEPFEDQFFDFVYATTLFGNLDKEDVFEYLLESHRVLKPGGIAYFDTLNLLHPDTYRIWLQSQRWNIGDSKSRGRLQFSTARELRMHLEEVGFAVERFDQNRVLRVLCRSEQPRPHDPDDGHPPFGYVDQPEPEACVRGVLHVTGWALDDVDKVEVFVDDSQLLGTAIYGDSRPDVGGLFPRYPEAPCCGFHLMVPLAEVGAGYRSLQVVASDRQGRRVDLAGCHLAITVDP